MREIKARKLAENNTKTANKKDKKKSQPLKDANGNDLKRPLSAYMLYNNYRRPVLRSEHPGKFLKQHTLSAHYLIWL